MCLQQNEILSICSYAEFPSHIKPTYMFHRKPFALRRVERVRSLDTTSFHTSCVKFLLGEPGVPGAPLRIYVAGPPSRLTAGTGSAGTPALRLRAREFSRMFFAHVCRFSS